MNANLIDEDVPSLDSLFQTRPAATVSKPGALVELWVMRMLVPLGGMRRFVRKHGMTDDDDGELLGIRDADYTDASGNFKHDQARRALQARHKRAEKRVKEASLPPALCDNLTRMTKLLGLSGVDNKLLGFATLLHTEPVLDIGSRQLGQMDSRRAYAVLAQLLDCPVQDVRASLSPDGQLVRAGLLRLTRSTDDLASKLELLFDGFADRMVSEPTSPEDIIKGSVNPAAPARLTTRHYEHLEAPVQLARSYLSVALQSARPGVNLLIYGPPGTGKTELARLLAQQLDYPLFEVASEDESGDAINGQRRMSALRAAQSIFARQRSLILFDEIEDIFRDRNDDPFGRRASAGDMKAWVNRTLENNAVPTLWLSNDIECMDAAFLRRFDMHIEVDIPPQSQREWILAECTQGVVGPSQVAQLARHERLAPAVVTRVASVVKAIESGLPTDGKPAAMLRLVNDSLQAQGLRPILAQDPNRLPELYDPVFVHADADPHAICQGLQRTLAGRLCLYGPPGTGKTAYARWIAEQCNKPLLVRRASDLMSMWVGESEKNIAKAFRQAQDEGAVLLIDEVDSFLQDRRGAQRSWEVSGVNEMLTQIESFAGLFIASTNLVEGLDPASLRRFDLKMKFNFMRPAQAWAMLQRQCQAMGLAAPDDRLWQHLRQLDQLTPGDFAMIARRHRFHPLPDAAAMVQALRQELVLKRGGAGGAIGFSAAVG